MEWTDIKITVPLESSQDAATAISPVAGGGIYIEDYSDIEAQVMEIAHIDLIEQELLDKSRDSVIIHLYVSPDDNPVKTIDKARSLLLASGIEHSIETNAVQQEDWENAWKQYYHTIEVGKQLAVVPSWEEYSGPRTILKLDPGMAFGTGTHETTLLCLEALDERITGSERILDIGTGSGILAIAALLLGAAEVTGIDIDPMCVRISKENAALNNVEERFVVIEGDLAATAGGKFDIITANIVADAIMRLAPEVTSLLAEGGLFISSGIINEREDEVARAIADAGLYISSIRRNNGWTAIIASHHPKQEQ